MPERPNILLILNDDMGFSDLGCYGGEVQTPSLDRLAHHGLRFTQFYNTARCCPSRASLLTGLHPHQTGIGILVDDDGPAGYPGNLNKQCVTIAEVLSQADYATYMSGKWHVAHDYVNVNDTWPCQRGFQRFYGTVVGAGSYYDPNTLTRDNENIEHEAKEDPDFFYTDAISDNAVTFVDDHAETAGDPSTGSGSVQPFFMYVAYTAPHWPLHALPEDVAKYAGRFDAGWDRLREERLKRMIAMGIIDPSWELSERDERVGAWDDVENAAWQRRRMEVYAAQIDRMDQGIGRIVRALEDNGQLDNTLILFLADNGACEEVLSSEARWLRSGRIMRDVTRDGRTVRLGNNPNVMPGGEDTYQSYGIGWANLSDTPFRKYKHWTHEGGIATPLIAHWPRGIASGGQIRHHPGQLTDIMATVLDITGAEYPDTFDGNRILPCEGTSLVPTFDGRPNRRGLMYWEHEGNAAVRDGDWKLVRDFPGPWELYDLSADRTETRDMAAGHPDKVDALAEAYLQWARRCGVVPREKLIEMWDRRRRGDSTSALVWLLAAVLPGLFGSGAALDAAIAPAQTAAVATALDLARQVLLAVGRRVTGVSARR